MLTTLLIALTGTAFVTIAVPAALRRLVYRPTKR